MTYSATADLADAFFTALAAKYGPAALFYLQVWQSESALRPSAHNLSGNASGLCQLMPATAKGLGWDAADCAPPPPVSPLAKYRALTAQAQLTPWIERYYQPWAAKITSPELAYLATFLPAYLEKPAAELVDSLVLCAEHGPLGWAYEANMVFDADRRGLITLGDLGAAVTRNCTGARWDEAAARLAAALGQPQPAPAPAPAKYDVRTVRGLEQALAALHGANGAFYQGPLDGDPGPLLRAAIKAFQISRGLRPDTIPGPITREALTMALRTSGAP